VTKNPALTHSSPVTVRDLGQPPVLAEALPGKPPQAALTYEFDAIYEQQFELVWRTLRRLGVAPAAVDDALQDVFLVVHRRLAEFEQRSSMRTWIFGITLRVASDYLRRGRRLERTTALDVELRDEQALDPLEHHARSEAVSLLYAALGQLDPDKRAAVVLAELEEMSLAEVAAAVGSNVNTVSSRVKAARRQFEAAVRHLRAKDVFRGQR